MRGSGDRVLRVQAQLTVRDWQLLDWLFDHRVLTTFQIAYALFGSLDFAGRRLLTLHRLGLLDRFRPLRPGGGSYPWHYVLDQLGAEVVAASRGEAAPRPGQTRERKRRTATSRTLDHRLGVNQFFTDLAGYARTHPPARLERWWSEQQCARPGAFAATLIAGVRPDGHGVFAQAGRRVAFFLEWDSGAEPLRVLVAKLASYDRFAAQGGPAWPVLFWLPNPTRERHLHRLLHDADLAVSIATAAVGGQPEGASGPADAVWLVHPGSDPPRRLIDLAGSQAGRPAPP